MSTANFDPWTMRPTEVGQREYHLCPAGNKPAVVAGLIYIGKHDTEETNDKGETRTVAKPQFVMVFETAAKEPNGQPFIFAKRVNWTVGEKSSIRKAATALGLPLEVGQPFDPRDMLGKFCLIQITHNPAKKDPTKVYANLSGDPGGWPEGMPTFSPVLPTVAYSVLESFQPLGAWAAIMDRPMLYGQSIRDLMADSHEAREKRREVNGRIAAAQGINPIETDKMGVAPF
jgi:hypothetical protein